MRCVVFHKYDNPQGTAQFGRPPKKLVSGVTTGSNLRLTPSVRVLHLFGRQVERNRIVLKVSAVRSIAERFVLGKSTTAYRNDRSALQAILVAIPVNNFEIAFNFYRSVVVNRKSSFSHFLFFLQPNILHIGEH